jgi:hypothetical protein
MITKNTNYYEGLQLPFSKTSAECMHGIILRRGHQGMPALLRMTVLLNDMMHFNDTDGIQKLEQ